MRWNSCSSKYSMRSALFPFKVCASKFPEIAVSCFDSGKTCNRNASRSTRRQSSAACRSNPQTFWEPEPRSCATSRGSNDLLPLTPNCVCANAANAYVVAPRRCSLAARYVSQISLPLVAEAWNVSRPDAAFQRCGGLLRLSRPTLLQALPTFNASARANKTSSSKPARGAITRSRQDAIAAAVRETRRLSCGRVDGVDGVAVRRHRRDP